MRCRFCFNKPILEFKAEFLVNLERVYSELEEQQFLIDGVIVTGGEPTLQPEALEALAEWIKQRDLQCGLMTNGTKPEVIKRLLSKQLLDYVAVDIKTVLTAKAYANLTQTKEHILPSIKDTITLLKKSKIQYEFRTTLVPELIHRPSQIRKIVKWVGAENYVLQAFRSTETLVDPMLLQLEFKPEELSAIKELAMEEKIRIRF